MSILLLKILERTSLRRGIKYKHIHSYRLVNLGVPEEVEVIVEGLARRMLYQSPMCHRLHHSSFQQGMRRTNLTTRARLQRKALLSMWLR